MIGLLCLGIIMKIKIDCTYNLGDFCNALPVISGLSKYKNEKVDLIIRPEMRKFNGIKEFLTYQPMINSVEFSDDVFTYGGIIELSSWTRKDQSNKNRPIETCCYENWVKDKYKIPFEVDDDFELLIEPISSGDMGYYIIGDRWSTKEDPGVDTRRSSSVIKNGADLKNVNVTYLDYRNSIMLNCNLIKQTTKPFITTFTGIGIIADLMNKETIVCWDEDMRMWDGHPVEYDFKRHYYGNRKSKLINVKELEL